METLRAASWRSAHVFKVEWQGEAWVVKDFRPSSWLFRRVIGPFLTMREVRALSALQGLKGVPADAFRIDSGALAYRYAPGESMRELRRKAVTLDGGFFPRLEALIGDMHARGIVHLDLRNAWNILATPEREPFIIDFQSSLRSGRLPRWLRRRLEQVDISGAYKWWARLSPGTFDGARAARLRKFHHARRLWPFRRFILSLKLRPARRLERRLPGPGQDQGPARRDGQAALSSRETR
jgi:predicted Ser/Thr protein kinase